MTVLPVPAGGATRRRELAEAIGARLTQRGERLAVNETAAGGLISAALLAVPGASAWFRGSAVTYDRDSRRQLLGLDAQAVRGLAPMSPEMATVFADRTRERLETDWAVAELGIAGPTGSPYGGPAGVAVLAVSGPVVRSGRLETGHADREANMQAFADAALELLFDALS
ncbi:MAG: CinA family protein [Gammaproteobacteria bacterium]|nr:CinA family protein [Gammaproteobacteria bacterium]